MSLRGPRRFLRLGDLMAWYQSDAEVPERLTFGSFLIRPIRGNDAPADHAALMAARDAIRAHGESDFPRDDFSVDEDRKDLDADARRLRPELVAARVDGQLVAAVRDWLTTAWSFPQVVWITRGHETRPRALLEQLGLRPVEPVGPDPSALVIYS
jgi:hypothetical protein